MLGRKDYSQEELDHGKAATKRQLASYRKLAGAVAGESPEDGAKPALEALERDLFNNLTLALDRYYVHRIRSVGGKDGNPLNEVEMIVDSLMRDDGVLQGSSVINYDPERSILGLRVGEEIRLTADDFERLSKAFFDELARRFL
jgi:hypothetical protein